MLSELAEVLNAAFDEIRLWREKTKATIDEEYSGEVARFLKFSIDNPSAQYLVAQDVWDALKCGCKADGTPANILTAPFSVLLEPFLGDGMIVAVNGLRERYGFRGEG